MRESVHSFFFFFNDTATTEIYTLSLHDALPISNPLHALHQQAEAEFQPYADLEISVGRSEEHTSELQSLAYLVCRLLLEKKKHCTSTSKSLGMVSPGHSFCRLDTTSPARPRLER